MKTGTKEEGGKKLPSLIELIDRYVPRHTREEVVEMSIKYEERITDLLMTIYDYQQRCQGLQEHLSKLEQEYGEATMVRVPFGNIEMETEYDIRHQVPLIRAMWRPDPLHAVITMPYEPLNREQFPMLFDAVMKQFERQFTTEAVKQISAQYAKLYTSTASRFR